MRAVGLLSIVALIAGCKVDAFACAGESDCVLGGEPGMCIAGNCAYPDTMCASGYRYAAGLGNALAGECVPEDAIVGTDGDTDPSVSTSSSDESSTSSSSSSSSTTDGTSDETTASTVPPMTVTTDPSDSSASMTGPAETGVPDECGGLACEFCFDCASAEGECVEATFECASAPGCSEVVSCFRECIVSGVCLVDCCAGFETDSINAAYSLLDCTSQVCAMSCEFFDPPCEMP